MARSSLREKIATKIFINGKSYTVDDVPYKASIPDDYFTKEDGLNELGEWLQENAGDIWWICFHDRTVRFRDEGDAAHMKLVLG